MAKRKYTAEEIVTVLRQVEVAIGNGKTTPHACREAGITEQTFYRWRKEYGGLKLEQAKRLKDLERENSWLKPSTSVPIIALSSSRSRCGNGSRGWVPAAVHRAGESLGERLL
jgi:putative transposase